MSKESKKDKDHSQAKPNNDGRENHKRHIEGNVGVHGQIEIHDPRSLKTKRIPAINKRIPTGRKIGLWQYLRSLPCPSIHYLLFGKGI
jgi:hypothetical protein